MCAGGKGGGGGSAPESMILNKCQQLSTHVDKGPKRADERNRPPPTPGARPSHRQRGPLLWSPRSQGPWQPTAPTEHIGRLMAQTQARPSIWALIASQTPTTAPRPGLGGVGGRPGDVLEGGHEATDTQLPNAPRVTGDRSGLTNVLLHCSTSKPVLKVALSSPTGYRMPLGLVWVSSLPLDTRLYTQGLCGAHGGEGGFGRDPPLLPGSPYGPRRRCAQHFEA